MNEAKPALYNSGISVIGENSVIPEGAVLGKNVVIHRDVVAEDYESTQVVSGKTVMKRGAGNE